MNFNDLLKVNELDSKKFRLVRHGFKEIDPLVTFQTNLELFVAYQSFQLIGKFGDAKYLAVFAPYHGTQALFLGIWKVDKEIPALEAPKKSRNLI